MKAKPPGVPNERLRQARIERGWSQEALAEKLGTNGFTVSRWELGQAVPSPYYRHKLAEVFAQTLASLGLLPAPAVPAGASVLPQPDASSILAPPLAAVVRDPLLPPSPRLSTGLIGREALLTQLKAWLLSGETVILSALHGLPGVGKTALALALAHDEDVRAHFADGILWAGLGQTPQVSETLARWGALLGLAPAETPRPSTPEAWAQVLRTAIGNRRFLFVLDDAWHVEAVLACQVGGSNCAYLVTTRRLDLALQVAGERLAAVPELAQDEGLALLAQFAPQVVEAEPEETRALVELVGGLPLGLLLVGKYLQREAHSGQPRRIRAALERLHQGTEHLRLAEPQALLEAHPSLPPQTPLSLQASIGLSAAALHAKAQAMLAALSLFPPKPNSFSEEAALLVSSGAAETLDALLDAGLVESAGPGRYTLHQTIADYARLQHGSEDAQGRFIAWGLQVIASTPAEAPIFDHERSNLLAALDLAYAQRQYPQLVQGVTHWADCFYTRGWYQTGLDQLRRAVEAARAMQDNAGLLGVLHALGRLAVERGDYAEAEAAYEEGIPLAHDLGQEERFIDLLTGRGVIWISRAELDRAETIWQEALALARQRGTPQQVSRLLTLLGTLMGRRGDLAASERYYQESVQVAAANGNRQYLGDAFQGLAALAARRGDYPTAGRYLHEGLEVARQLQYRERIRGLLSNLGALALDQGYPATAQGYLEEALAIARAIGHREGLCHVLVNLGEVAIRQKDLAHAQVYLEEGLELARELGHQERLCALLVNLGQVALSQGHLEEAEARWREGSRLAQALQDRWRQSALLSHQGQLHLARHAWEAAQATFAEALELALQVESPEREAAARYGLAQVAAGRGERDEARAQAEESLRLFEQIGYYQAAEVKQWLGNLERGAQEARSQHAEMVGQWNRNRRPRAPRME
jgi:transcriptional regulator with XRE-family HTH domain/uncharacterized protein HemY